MLSAIVKAIVAALIEGLRGWFADRKAEQANRDLGAAQAGQETQGVVADVADQQAQNNALPRDPLDIAGRLRGDADAADGSGRAG